MGRTKSIPVQQPPHLPNDDKHEPILGRRTLFSKDHQPMAAMIHTLLEEEDDDDDNDDDSNDRGQRKIRCTFDDDDDAAITEDVERKDVDTRMMCVPQQQRQRQRRHHLDSRSSNPSSMKSSSLSNIATIVERVEYEESMKRRRKRSVLKPPSSDLSKTKMISFAPDSVSIPSPELRIVQQQQEHSLENCWDDTTTTHRRLCDSDNSGVESNVKNASIDSQNLERSTPVSSSSSNKRFVGYYCPHDLVDQTADHGRESSPVMMIKVTGWLYETTLPSYFQLQFPTTITDPMMSQQYVIILPIITKQGAIDMWTLVTTHLMNGQDGSSISLSNRRHGIEALGRAVEAGNVRLELSILRGQVRRVGGESFELVQQMESSRVKLRIGLTEQALCLCQNDQLNISAKYRNVPKPSILRNSKAIKRGKKPFTYRSNKSATTQVQDIHYTLATLFPTSEIADVLDLPTNQTNSTVQPNTAKRIYSIVDNVQLQRSMQSDTQNQSVILSSTTKVPASTLTIPGLIPTLRPYQSKAVEWMIQREQQGNDSSHDSSCSNNEWELAWIVLNPVLATANVASGDVVAVTDTIQSPPTPMSLPQWKRQCTKNTDGTLLFCPYTGWLTNSIERAREMTVGPSYSPMKGGILAESMGLGKTVEVLACILANPYIHSSTGEAAISSSRSTAVQRQLDFSDSSQSPDIEDGVLADRAMVVYDNAPTSTFVGEIHDFGDADEDSEDDDGSNSSVNLNCMSSDLIKPLRKCTTVAATTMTTNPDTRSTVSTPVLVTPTKESNDICSDERWVDTDILGSCICGSLIGFDCSSAVSSIIICSSCEEPMHLNCAAFDSVDEMRRMTRPRRYRHTFSNAKLDCRVCDKVQCPCCVASVQSGATLIITPPAILCQWEREINRHTRQKASNLPLRVVVYTGIKSLSQSHSVPKDSFSIKFMHPRHLADADIVLMSFDALMDDLGHTDDNQFVSRNSVDEVAGGNLRKRKRYRVVPSPLLSIKWWRVCLDEAQRVETPTKAAQMAIKLHTVNRWCISGTPIQHGSFLDLYGLLLFLRLEPFCEKSWFQKCFNHAYRNIDERIKHLLLNLFWRSTKDSDLVREQMGIPEQVEKKIMLKLSSIEKHFYNRQLEQTIQAAGDVNDQPGRIGKRNSAQLHLLSDQLHKLRAACCHPQVGSSGISSLKRRRSIHEGDASVSSRVMTMGQILDKFIEDAKIQCEESQRLAVLHTNGMAATSKLKVEAKRRGISISESDLELLERSCSLYSQSLQLADENGAPTLVWGEVLLSGSQGFRTPVKTMQSYSLLLEWQRLGKDSMACEVWAKFDVSLGPSRRITQLKARTRKMIPRDLMEDTSANFKWHLAFPKDCIFQCMTSSGEFVNVQAFSLPHPHDHSYEWTVSNGFRTNKSKSWRLLIKTFHALPYEKDEKFFERNCCGVYVGLELECFEATIANDPLQRLHCLYNASLSYVSLLQQEASSLEGETVDQSDILNNTRERIDRMNTEGTKIESLYLDGARAFHRECRRRLEESSAVRKDLEGALLDLSREMKMVNVVDCWDDFWWDDFLVTCHLYGNETQHRIVCDKLIQDLDGMLQHRSEASNRNDVIPFPVFGEITGLRTALQMRIRDIRLGLGNKSSRRNQLTQSSGASNVDKNSELVLIPSPREGRFKCAAGGHSECIRLILQLNENPSDVEIHENSRCCVCKADWFQTGPKCGHCKIGDMLEDLTPDKVTLLILNSLYSLVKGNLGSNLLQSSGTASLVTKRAKIFFELLEASRKEKTAAYRLWRTHLNLLNDMDELSQCKSTMRLTKDGEDVTALSKEQLNAVISPTDINACFHDHAAKQAMALGALSRAKGTLQFLKNLSFSERQIGDDASVSNVEVQTCMVCLSAFDTDRAVLRCGHSFHLSPCLEKLRSRSDGSFVSCPLRCRIRTLFDEVMIASEGKRHDDGSRSTRRIKGSYGTKVTRLVNDVLDICDLGDKGLVFSQWDDMLDICEQALSDNGVQFVRVASLRHIGTCTRRFREPDCSIMLLNAKNGAEGLTLIEATHVFMVEPLLNYGLDSQGKQTTYIVISIE
jgi:SNF2 family DNA or RNA helicase